MAPQDRVEITARMVPSQWRDGMTFEQFMASETACGAEIEISNRSERTVKEVRVALEVYRPGDSKNEAPESFNELVYTAVLSPGGRRVECVHFPDHLQVRRAHGGTLVLNVKRRRVQFYEPGEFVPTSAK